MVIFNEGQEGRTAAFLGTLGGPGATVPVVGAAFDVGVELADGGVEVRMFVNATSEIRSTSNVIAETPGGRDDRVVVVGAHLDSVPEGPGIQDNGSGSAAILEIALQMAEDDIEPYATRCGSPGGVPKNRACWAPSSTSTICRSGTSRTSRST